jgi:hypothetical protein
VSYLAQSALTNFDQIFKARLSMCVSEQAKLYIDDPDPAYNLLANQAIGSYMSVTDQMLPLVATQPGITSESSDADILSAVQFLWPTVGGRLVPPAPMPPEANIVP